MFKLARLHAKRAQKINNAPTKIPKNLHHRKWFIASCSPDYSGLQSLNDARKLLLLITIPLLWFFLYFLPLLILFYRNSGIRDALAIRPFVTSPLCPCIWNSLHQCHRFYRQKKNGVLRFETVRHSAVWICVRWFVLSLYRSNPDVPMVGIRNRLLPSSCKQKSAFLFKNGSFSFVAFWRVVR